MPWDLAVMNSVFRSNSFPPLDSWFGTKLINYYYFGLSIFGILAKAVNTLPTYLFNLITPTIFAVTSQSFFGLIINLIGNNSSKKKVLSKFGLIGVFIYLFSGNIYSLFVTIRRLTLIPDGFYRFFRIGLEKLDGKLAGETPWFSTAYPGTIDIAEFPGLNVFLANPHPHVISMMYFVLFISVCLVIFKVKDFDFRFLFKYKFWTVLLWIFLGTVLMNNSWDAPVLYLFLFLIVLIKTFPKLDRIIVVQQLYTQVWVFLPIILVYLPFFVTVRSPVSSISPLPKVTVNPLDFFYVFGIFLTIIGAFLALIIKTPVRADRSGKQTLPLTGQGGSLRANILVGSILLVGPYLAWIGMHILRFAKRGEEIGQVVSLVTDNIIPVLPFALMFGVVGLFSYNVIRQELNRNRLSLLTVFCLLLTVSFAIPYGVELFMIREAWGIKFGTIFKYYYLLWSLLALVSAYSIYYLYEKIKHSTLLRFSAITLAVISLIFPVTTLIYEIKTSSGLSTDGLAHLDQREQEAINWINKNINDQSLILEGMYANIHLPRVSTYTGHPTVLGTVHLHENLFRPPGIDFAQIEEDIRMIYTTADEELICRYGIQYIFVGKLEKELYGKDVLFNYEKIYSNDKVTLYRI